MAIDMNDDKIDVINNTEDSVDARMKTKYKEQLHTDLEFFTSEESLAKVYAHPQTVSACNDFTIPRWCKQVSDDTEPYRIIEESCAREDTPLNTTEYAPSAV